MGVQMNTHSTKPNSTGLDAAALNLSRAAPIVMAFLLGTFIVGGVGFSHMTAVHNAAHDYRHSMGFPCH